MKTNVTIKRTRHVCAFEDEEAGLMFHVKRLFSERKFLRMGTTQRIFVIGDIHGNYTKLTGLLRQANLVDEALSWCGGTATLWFMGDFCDRGPDGIAVLDLVMRLQREASEAGGQVSSLLGNHEIAMLSARFLGERACSGPGGTFRACWLYNGGKEQDLNRLTDAHIEWMMHLPTLAHVVRAGAMSADEEGAGTRSADEAGASPAPYYNGWLFQHADSAFYLEYGSSLGEVNAALADLLERKQEKEWDRLQAVFSHRREFLDSQPNGSKLATRLLETIGGERLLHGHTCISTVTGQKPEDVTEALVYAQGLCVNVDGGMYLGGPGFLFELPDDSSKSGTIA